MLPRSAVSGAASRADEEESSDEEYDMEMYDDDGLPLVDEAGEELIPFERLGDPHRALVA